MLPKTRSGERVHREHKRHLEIGIILEEISSLLNNDAHFVKRNIRILEFGSGDGFQIPHLKRLGQVVASDIYTSGGIKELQDIDFVECGITDAPFPNGQFDLIFSNHVIEHIEYLQSAFREIQRIGSSTCVYAFSVPTNIWLLLSIPAQYYNRFRNSIRRLKYTSTINPNNSNDDNSFFKITPVKFSTLTRLIRLLVPEGHGVNSNFVECYRYFRINSWQKLFLNYGFSIIKTKPLLLYGPSEWPTIPTIRPINSVCSSVLFLMQKSP